jgi:hypothetical protein
MKLKATAVNIYLVERTHEVIEYDSYESMVVVAQTEEDARSVHPEGYVMTASSPRTHVWTSYEGLSALKVTLLGKAVKGVSELYREKAGVIVTSFYAN